MPDKDKDKKSAPDAGDAAAAPAKKKPPIKVIGIVAGIMIVEAALVYVLVGKMKGPATVEAKQVEGHADDGKALVELPLIEEKFQNMQTGQVWIWDVAVYLKVRQKHADSISAELEARQAEIKEAIATLFRKAQHSQLREPGLETLTRQLTAYVNKIIEPDAEGKSRIERVLIPKCKGFAAG